MIFVTGGAGFIGSNFIRHWVSKTDEPVLNIDVLTYAGNLANLSDLDHQSLLFARVDILDRAALDALFSAHAPRAVLHFAAESHVDRSIHAPDAFVRTNVNGTFTLLEAARQFASGRSPTERQQFRFLHVSTDEVYGSLEADAPAFTESSTYQPNSPYAATKAASDHLVRAYHHTYDLPILTTNCSNNYGPYQFPEKLIPLMITRALAGERLPVYGDGANVRDWLYVEDHCTALVEVLARGTVGETYNIGGCNEKTNLEVVRSLCATLDALMPRAAPYFNQVEFVADRPGHDRRYAIDAGKIERQLGWRPAHTFETGLAETVRWYLAHRDWSDAVTSGAYRQWVDLHYGVQPEVPA